MIQDLIHSLRRLVAHPGIAFVAIVSLALGIGADSAMFSGLFASLLRPLPYAELERRVIVFNTALNSPTRNNWDLVTPADILDWRAQSTTLEEWHVFAHGGASTALGAGLPERIMTQHVTAGLLDSLGVRPVIGRFFRAGEERERPALISEGYWHRSFSGSGDVLGRKLTVFGRVHTIIGVVPADFELFRDLIEGRLTGTPSIFPPVLSGSSARYRGYTRQPSLSAACHWHRRSPNWQASQLTLPERIRTRIVIGASSLCL